MDVNRKIRIDGDYLQSYQDDYMEIQVDKMNQRVTFFSIIFILLMGITFAFGFFYVRSNVTKVPEEVQALSHEVVQRLSTISERHTQMESSFHSKLSLLEKVTEALRKDQKEIQDAIDKINRTKADQNDVGRIIGKSSQENFKAIEEVRTHLNTLNTTFTDQFNQFSGQFETFNKDINDVLNNSVAKIQKDVQKKMDSASDRFQTINTEMNAFAKNVKTLDSNMRTLKSDIDKSNKRISQMSSAMDDISSDLAEISIPIKDMIDSDHLDELLAIERKGIQNDIKLQKVIFENHIKLLDGKLGNLKQQVENMQQDLAQSRQKKTSTMTKPVVKKQLPVKTRNKDLIQKTESQGFAKPVVIKPPPGGMIEEDLSE